MAYDADRNSLSLKKQLIRLRSRVREEGLWRLPGWALRWFYWNGFQRTRLLLQEQGQALKRELWPKPPVCESVKDWSRQQPGSHCQVVRGPEQVFRKLPLTIEPEIDEIFHKRLVYVVPEKYLARLNNTRLVGANGMIVLPDRNYVLELAFGSQLLLERETIYGKSLPQPARKKSGTYYSLLLLWADIGNYYHWMHDVLMRLHLILDLLPADTQFIVPAGLQPFQLETLRLLGLADRPRIEFSGNEVWELETLYFSPPTSRSGHDSVEADLWLRERIFSFYNIKSTSPHKRIYISRRFAKQRRTINDNDVEIYLHHYGFETYLTEHLSFREQVELFAQAKVIVSNEGAGLTNMLFASPGAIVVDIQVPTARRYGFWTMSEALGHSYWYFDGQPIPSTGYDPNLFVPLDKLRATLDRILLHE